MVKDMKCPRCNTEMSENYCIKCGYLIHEQEEYQLKRDFMDKNLLADFLGMKYAYFLERKFNVSAALLGPIYIGYRKLWKEGILCLLLDILLCFGIFYAMNHLPIFSSSFDPTNILQMLFLFGFIFSRSMIYGCFFNPYYIKKISTSIVELDRLEIKNKPKTSVGQALILSLLYPLILVLIFLGYQSLK